jgi:polyisoprenoid-binding protein YceI
VYDPANPAASKVEATVGVDTIDTRNAKRDDHLKSPDFFDAAKFPLMKFVSKKVEQRQPGKLAVTGDLTIHGVTKEVVLTVDGPTEEIKDPMGNLKRGASATATLNRKDFGLTWNKVLETGGVAVGDEVQVTIDLEMTKKG